MSDSNEQDRENGPEDRDSDKGGDGSTERSDGRSEKDRSEKDTAEKDEADKKPSLVKRPLFWIVLVVVAAVIAVSALLYWMHARQYESTDDAFVDAHIVRIASQVSGTLVQVADLDNRHVDAGRLLAVIEGSRPEGVFWKFLQRCGGRGD